MLNTVDLTAQYSEDDDAVKSTKTNCKLERSVSVVKQKVQMWEQLVHDYQDV